MALLDAYPANAGADQPPATPEEVRRALLIMAGTDTADDIDLDSDDAVPPLREHHAAMGSLTVEQVRVITDVVSHFAALMRAPTGHRRRRRRSDALRRGPQRRGTSSRRPLGSCIACGFSVHYTELPVNHRHGRSEFVGRRRRSDGGLSMTVLAADALRRQILDGPATTRRRSSAISPHGTLLITDDPDDPGC